MFAGLEPGQQIMRRELHERAGGQTQSGISPSTSTPVVMLFSNPAAGEQHGYFDGWHSDGFFHYSGEGQRGDQEMRRGNKRIRNHALDGRTLQLFLGDGKGQPVTYVGEFEYVDHYETDAPETNGGPLRRVFSFRLRAIDALPPPPYSSATSPSTSPVRATQVSDVPTEEHHTERYFLDRASEVTEAERREAALVKDYEAFIASRGGRLRRTKIAIAGELKPLYCDLFDAETNTLIEAKGSVTREAIRMGIGQLFDYRRFFEATPRLALLLPELPRPDLIELAHSCGIQIVHRANSGFSESIPPAEVSARS